MATPEGKVKAEIKKYLDSLGSDCWYFCPMMNGYGRKGIPDIIGCYDGKFFAIEVKAFGKVDGVTLWQGKELSAIRDTGGISFVADNVGVVRAILRKV